MSSRDRRQLKARIEQHRTASETPTVPGEVPEDTSMERLESAGLLFGRHDPQRLDARPLTVEYVALRLQEAVIRKEGRDGLNPGVVLDCVGAARLMIKEARRG